MAKPARWAAKVQAAKKGSKKAKSANKFTGWSRQDHIDYRRPITEARHARQRGEAEREQAWRQRAIKGSSAPDAADPADVTAGPYGATWDSATQQVQIGWLLPGGQRNPEYYSAIKAGFIQPRSAQRSRQFTGMEPFAGQQGPQ